MMSITIIGWNAKLWMSLMASRRSNIRTSQLCSRNNDPQIRGHIHTTGNHAFSQVTPAVVSGESSDSPAINIFAIRDQLRYLLGQSRWIKRGRRPLEFTATSCGQPSVTNSRRPY
uniref:Uncharacterized protein n=1 Tax=Cannabis sativa TaxID=3483 RepID=A0A803PBF3_CANSA